MTEHPLDNLFGPLFIQGFARNIINNWEVAIIELIANSFDAGAKNVRISINEESPQKLVIEDDGCGMTKEEFMKRWNQCGYNRTAEQGLEIYFPDGTKTNRRAYGKNGKGRFAMYCFSNRYLVEIWKESVHLKFEVKKGKIPFVISLLEEETLSIKKFGFKLEANIENQLFLEEDEISKLIGSKFYFDPSFHIYVNNHLITEEDLGNMISNENLTTSFGEVLIEIVKTKRGRTSRLNGIAWWVNNRKVGDINWKLADEEPLDRRYREARMYTFIIIADILQNDVKDDWTGFEETERYSKVFNEISKYLINKVDVLFQKSRNTRKQNIFSNSALDLKKLDIISRDFISNFIDDIIKKCPHIKDKDFENILEIMINLENSNSKFKLLGNLAKLETAELEDLNEIIEKWSIKDSKIILKEINDRLVLIDILEELSQKQSDELHKLQPVIERCLWIFGPEYDSLQYTSNNTLTNVLRKLFKIKSEKRLSKRPDFVVRANSTIGIYSSENYDIKGEVQGIGNVLILELKRGNSILNYKEISQAEQYCLHLLEEGHINRDVNVKCFVLGTRVGKFAKEKKTGDGDNVFIKPYNYSGIIKIARKRLFNLKEKIESYKKINDQDEIMRNILSQSTIN